jgi:tricorn protease
LIDLPEIPMPSIPAWPLAAATLLLAGTVTAADTRLLRQPALSPEHLAFVYAGDLWLSARDGSAPRRLTTAAADEHTPIFSPDGQRIAFAANYNGNTDVYVIDVAGGQPQRLTWHPGDDLPVDWAHDGSAVALVSTRETDHGRSGQLFHVGFDGSPPVRQMDARFFRGAWDATGQRLAYIDHGAGYNGLFGGSAGWKGYRGGTSPSIRILEVADQRVTDIPGERVTDFNPFWLDGQVYFLSDREDEVFNLYRYDPASSRIDKLTDETDWDIRAASGRGRNIVYEAGGAIKALDLDGGSVQTLAIELNPDLPQLRPGWKSVAGTIQGIDISPNGKRAIVTARGEVFTVPADKGSTRNLSESSGVREYAGLWSPKGDQVAWIEEALSGQTLVVADQTGQGETRRFELGPDFYALQAWHADSGRIVFSDNHLKLFVIELERGRIDRLATQARRAGFEVAFSPDGRWLAYTLEQPNFHADLMLHDFESGRATQVSDGMADVASPAFDPEG